MRYSIFFAVLLHVIIKFGMRYSYYQRYFHLENYTVAGFGLHWETTLSFEVVIGKVINEGTEGSQLEHYTFVFLLVLFNAIVPQ